MNNFTKKVIATVVLLLFTGCAVANFWSELYKCNPGKEEAIVCIYRTLVAGLKPNATEELKAFAQQLITDMSNYPANSKEWEELVTFFDTMVQEYKRHPVDFCEFIKDPEACNRLLKSKVTFFTTNIPGEELIPFLNNTTKKK
jgi:hypothetical protein